MEIETSCWLMDQEKERQLQCIEVGGLVLKAHHGGRAPKVVNAIAQKSL